MAILFVVSNALTPKLCIRCKHFITNDIGHEFSRCTALPKRTYIDMNHLVTGKTTCKDDYWYCSTARSSENLCGTSGKLFQLLDTLDGR